MMKQSIRKRIGVGGVLCAAGLAISAPVLAQADGLAMLSGLAKGEWTIKFRDGSPERKICLKEGQELIQLRHPREGCNRFVVDDSPSRVTVQYTCPGDGYGRTNIRKETASLVQIEGQGIAGGSPFQFAAEARRTGVCQ